MERVVFLLLLVSGLCFLSSCLVQHQYLFIPESKTWFDAQRYCREKCIDLATIHDMEEMRMALKVVEGRYDDGVWIGIYKGDDLIWYSSLDHGERGINYWNLEGGDSAACLGYSGGELLNQGCNKKKYSVCFDGSKHGREQYVLNDVTMAWTNAQNYCRTRHTDLVSVRNETEEDMLREVAAGYQVWVGYFRDKWTWSDQTYSSFRYWSSVTRGTQNDRKCGALLRSKAGKWGKAACKEAHPFICTCPITRIIKIRVTPQKSQLDLNDPAVQDEILKQIRLKQSLMKEGDAVQIRWRKRPDGKVFIKEAN
ncbi:putative C-type lectin domain family 20 member A [Antennarius striatus]|uniref:putative C-type lectin domain family 20 member A n=1 Tax=Antennarius striatus TaxID=241820 RepID=UPI0035B4BF6C